MDFPYSIGQSGKWPTNCVLEARYAGKGSSRYQLSFFILSLGFSFTVAHWWLKDHGQ